MCGSVAAGALLFSLGARSEVTVVSFFPSAQGTSPEVPNVLNMRHGLGPIMARRK